MRNGKGFIKFLMICVLAVGAALIPNKAVQAANPTAVTLKVQKKYTAYDVTGDKKADTVYIKTTPDRFGNYNAVAVSINGKVVYQIKNEPFFVMETKILTLGNGKPFLYFYAAFENGDGPVCGVFQYRSGKLVQVINFQTLCKKYGTHQSGEIVRVSGNSMKARFSVMSYSLGLADIDYTYAYQSGSLRRTSKTGTYYRIMTAGKQNRTFTANRTLNVYRAPGSSGKAFVLKKGNRVTVGKCWVSGSNMYIQLKYNRKSGWIKASTTAQKKYMQFSNVTLAG